MFKTEPLYSSTPASGSSNKNLNNLLADDDEPQAEPPGLIQQILNFFSKLWSPSTSDAEKLGYSYIYAEDGSLLGEYGSGGSNSTGTAQYIYLPTASGPMPIAAVIKGQTYAVHSDHLNTPRKLTQPDGQVAWQWAYSAFGDEQPTIGAKRFTSETTTPTTGATSIPEVTFNLRYPGQYFDPETKLHYNYFRTYAPGTGRYTQGDPIGLDGGWNRFGYVGGNPLNSTDMLGLYESSPWLRAFVPGQAAFDNGMTALENGNYGAAALSFGTMVAEQVVTALSFGVSNTTRSLITPISAVELAAAKSAASTTVPQACVPDVLYGPFHRLGDSPAAIEAIKSTGLLIGNPSRNYMHSPFPKVKAYEGALPAGKQGFEFFTKAAPDVGHIPGQPVWMPTRTGVSEVNGQAVISCTVSRVGC